MAQAEALQALADIRHAIDRSTRYSTFSALSGFLAGAAAFIGSGGCGYYKSFVGARADDWNFVYVWAAVFTFAAVQHAALTAFKARRRGEAIWTPIARTAFLALLGPGLAGVLASFIFAFASDFQYLTGLWLTLYGCGLWSVSFFAPRFLRWLGCAFGVLGILAWGLKDSQCVPGLFLGLGFGGLHTIFGFIGLARYRK
jgi:hypothetical protein